MIMSYYREIKCPKCGTLVGIKEVNGSVSICVSILSPQIL